MDESILRLLKKAGEFSEKDSLLLKEVTSIQKVEKARNFTGKTNPLDR